MVPPLLVPPKGMPAVAVTSQYPFAAAPAHTISRGLEQEVFEHSGHEREVMREMTGKNINDDTLVTYLVVINICDDVRYPLHSGPLNCSIAQNLEVEEPQSSQVEP
jgi:hypothetical protein